MAQNQWQERLLRGTAVQGCPTSNRTPLRRSGQSGFPRASRPFLRTTRYRERRDSTRSDAVRRRPSHAGPHCICRTSLGRPWSAAVSRGPQTVVPRHGEHGCRPNSPTPVTQPDGLVYKGSDGQSHRPAPGRRTPRQIRPSASQPIARHLIPRLRAGPDPGTTARRRRWRRGRGTAFETIILFGTGPSRVGRPKRHQPDSRVRRSKDVPARSPPHLSWR